VDRIAILRANALGDFVFALPALDALRAAYPTAEITLLGRSWHAAFLTDRPGPVDRLVVVPGDGSPDAAVGGRHADAPWLAASASELKAFAAQMRQQRFDLAVQIHGGGRNSNPLVSSLGARLTVGLRTVQAPPLDRWVRYVYYQQEVLRCLEVVGLVGAGPTLIEPQLTVTDSDRRAARRLLGEQDAYVVLHPGANDARRRWPAASFGAIGDALADHGLQPVITGSSAEARLAQAVSDALRHPARNLAGKTSLSALAGILAGARIVVSNDSGPLHLAAAVGAPTVGIYWCGNLINGGPLTRGRHRPVISWRVSCPVCGVPASAPRCEHDDSFVADITVDEVHAAVIDLLETEP
jgi:ADP-heptose:LPS heptosyltransferase